MTMKCQTSPAVLPMVQTGVVERIFDGLSKILTAHRNRRQVNMLANFNERMLRDIGLTSADIESALQEPLWVDPSRHLVHAADSRKRYRFRRLG